MKQDTSFPCSSMGMCFLTLQRRVQGMLERLGMSSHAGAWELDKTLYAQMEEATMLDVVICKNLEVLGYGE